MKKIITILFLYLSIQTTQAMIIDNIVVSPLNSQDINIHLKVTEGAEFYFQNSSYNITKNSITLTVCYILSEPQLLILTTRENDIVISTVNNEVTNYNLTVIVNYIDEQGNCVTGPFSDSESMTFYTPLTNTISLSNNSFDNLNRNLIIILVCYQKVHNFLLNIKDITLLNFLFTSLIQLKKRILFMKFLLL